MRKIIEFITDLFSQSTCSFKEQYQLYCPGCGGTRAVKYFFQFNFLDSLYANPLVMLVALDIIIFIILPIYEQYKWKRRKRLYKLRAQVIGGTMIIWMLFSIVRNVLLKYAAIDFLGDIL